MTHYRFSISWSRILPLGTIHQINQAGIAYYNSLIDALIDANIVPMVTLYHWDLPQALNDTDGWLNRTVADNFADYAELCFTEFGDRVSFFPYVHCTSCSLPGGSQYFSIHLSNVLANSWINPYSHLIDHFCIREIYYDLWWIHDV